MKFYIVEINRGYEGRRFKDKQAALNYAAQIDTMHGEEVDVYEKDGLKNTLLFHK